MSHIVHSVHVGSDKYFAMVSAFGTRAFYVELCAGYSTKNRREIWFVWTGFDSLNLHGGNYTLSPQTASRIYTGDFFTSMV